MDAIPNSCLEMTWIEVKRKEREKKLNPIDKSEFVDSGTFVHIDRKGFFEKE
jgi:hypothetical protein